MRRAELLRRFLDGELDGAEREAFARARREDPAFDAEVQQLASVRRRLRDATPSAPKVDLTDRIMAALPARPPATLWTRARGALSSPLWTHPATALAALLAVLLLVPLLLWVLSRRPAPPPAPRTGGAVAAEPPGGGAPG